MPEEADALQAIRDRIVQVLQSVIGYEIPPGTDQVDNVDSLQVLEFLVSLEEEFDIDSDKIIEARTDWWLSIDELARSIADLAAELS
jgi:acyl carrier protein